MVRWAVDGEWKDMAAGCRHKIAPSGSYVRTYIRARAGTPRASSCVIFVSCSQQPTAVRVACGSPTLPAYLLLEYQHSPALTVVRRQLAVFFGSLAVR